MEFGIFYVGVETMLIHDSGEWIKGTVSVPVVATELIEVFTRRFNKDGDAYYASPNILQEAGKIITYLRRYGIVSNILQLFAPYLVEQRSKAHWLSVGWALSQPPHVLTA